MNKNNLKICLVSSHGGHLHELMNATKDLEGNFYWVTYKTKHTSKILQEEKHYFVIDPHLSKIKFVFNAFQSLFHLLKERPQVIISTGAGIALPTLVLGKFLFNSKVIYIESVACVNELSKSGAYMYEKADLFLVQWDNLIKKYPQSKNVDIL